MKWHGGKGMRGKKKMAVIALALATLLAASGCATPPTPPGPVVPPGSPDDRQETSVDPGPSTPFDQAYACLPGVWEVDKSSVSWQIAAGDADEVSGTFFIMFDPAGGFGLEYQSWRVLTYIDKETGISTEGVWDGMVTGEYTVGEDGTVETSVIHSSATLTTVMSTPVGDDRDVIDIDIPIPTVYKCDGDQIIGFAKTNGDEVIRYNISERTFD